MKYKTIYLDPPWKICTGGIKHSRKPHIFYDIIEDVSYGPFLELFARNKRDNWDSWGPHCDINDIK